MSEYQGLVERLNARDVILLDGAVGTQLQAMGVPMNLHAWAGAALQSHPFTVRRMHEDYVAAGVDVITTNTYASARHNLEPLGLGDQTRELNLRAVMLAEDARDKKARERPVSIAGSVSNFGLIAGAEEAYRETYKKHFANRSETSVDQARANLREQAEILAESGVDLLIAEATGSTEQRRWVIEACLSTGLPVWSGFKCHLREGEAAPRVGYRSDDLMADDLDELLAMGGSVAALFHSTLDATRAGLPLIQERWSGPIAIYPEAERHDYVSARRDPAEEGKVSPADFQVFAEECVAAGVQIIGGCCGIELDHIRPLRDALPRSLAS